MPSGTSSIMPNAAAATTLRQDPNPGQQQQPEQKQERKQKQQHGRRKADSNWDIVVPGSSDEGEPMLSGHKPLWPLSDTDLIVFALAAATLVLAAGGGIGGGAIYMPLYVTLGGFGPGQAVALSNLTILGGALANLFLNMQRSHPRLLGRPLIDWTLILIMEPTTILGALVGSYLNKIFPSVLTITLLTALLTLLTLQLVRRGIKTFRAETKEKRAAAAAVAAAAVADTDLVPAADDAARRLREPLLPRSDGKEGQEDCDSGLDDQQGDRDQQQQQQAEGSSVAAADGRRSGAASPEPVSFQLDDVGDSDGSDCGTDGEAGGGVSAARQGQADASMQGGEGTGASSPGRAWIPGNGQQQQQQEQQQQQQQQQLLLQPAADMAVLVSSGAAVAPQPKAARRRCHAHLPFWPTAMLVLLTAAVAGSDIAKALVACGSWQYWAVVLSVVPPSLAVTLIARQGILRRGAAAGDNIKYTPRNTLVYPLICSTAGIVAGLFGLGGGVVKAPLMLELGVLPDVAAATSATMIAFTSLSACVVYANFGLIPLDYGAALLALGVLSSAAGQVATTRLVRALGRRSVIVFLMATLMCLATGAASYHAITRWADIAAGGTGAWEWGGICGAHDM